MGSNWAAKKEISAVSHPSAVIMPILCLFRSRQRTLCRQLRFVGFAFSALKMSSMAQLTEFKQSFVVRMILTLSAKYTM